jgi:hypothetical protein
MGAQFTTKGSGKKTFQLAHSAANQFEIYVCVVIICHSGSDLKCSGVKKFWMCPIIQVPLQAVHVQGYASAAVRTLFMHSFLNSA